MNPPDSTFFTDLHSHLVPGVDDGARTLEETLEGIQRLRDEGIRSVATTPHLDGSLTRRPDALEARLREVHLAWSPVLEEASITFPDMVFIQAFEVMLDVPDADFSDPRTRLGDTSFVLVEWPRLKVPPAAGPALARIRDAGYQVILAHPERYHGLDTGLNLPGEWREMGARLQVNYGSLVGRYGDEPRRRALTLLERGWVDLFATDYHGRPHLPVYLGRAREVMDLLEGAAQFDLLSRTNPARILRGEDPLPAPPLPHKKGVWEKVRDLFSSKE